MVKNHKIRFERHLEETNQFGFDLRLIICSCGWTHEITPFPMRTVDNSYIKDHLVYTVYTSLEQK